MIKYEVLIFGEKGIAMEFESPYEIKINERIFLEREGKMYMLNVMKITHNLKKGVHVVRLNCHSNLYVED